MKHIWLLVIAPILLAVVVFFLTKDQPKSYTSTSKIYTGIASGSSIESLDNQRFDFFATNTAFDNLINIISARNTVETVGLVLFTQHMLLKEANPKIISKEKYDKLMEIVPDEVKNLVVYDDSAKTIANFLALKNSGHENFIYKLINLEHPDYSAGKIQKKIVVRRISNSDIIELKYNSDDPGICQNTLLILTQVFVKLHSDIKVNQSDAVVKYFQYQLDDSNNRLHAAEDELLEFNRSNNIINYYEQTKHIASQKEHFEMEYQTVQMNYYGTSSVLTVLESKMDARQKLQITSSQVVEKRKLIADLNFKIAMRQMQLQQDSSLSIDKDSTLNAMLIDADKLNKDLRQLIDTLSMGEMNTNGLVTSNVLEDWLKNVIAFESSKAQLKLLDQKRIEFKELYAVFAPLGATMKRLERKIDVAEKEYLSLLHSLGLAKLKQQNIELTSNLKVVDEPYYPIIPEPSKRKILVAIAGIMGFILVAFTILLLEFFDKNLRSASRAEEHIGLKVAGIFPKMSVKNFTSDITILGEKATDTIARNVLFIDKAKSNVKTKPFVNYFISTQQNDGKSFVSKFLLSKMVNLGYKVLQLTFAKQEVSETINYSVLTYEIGDQFYRVSELQELGFKITDSEWDAFDYIFVELPNVIQHAFPVKLLEKADHIYLVCRANRDWSVADKNAIKSFTELVPFPIPSIILNGVEWVEMETILGDLPKKRTWFRKFFKNFIRMRFFSKSHII